MQDIQINEAEIEERMKMLKQTKVNEQNERFTIDKEEYVENIADKSSSLKAHIEDIKTLFGIIKDKEKFKPSSTTIALIIGTLLYVISPIDMIPDALPAIGFLDDAAIIAATVEKIKVEIEKYKEWKKMNS